MEYIVQQNETIEDVARKTGSSPDEIARINLLSIQGDRDLLRAGDILEVPGEADLGSPQNSSEDWRSVPGVTSQEHLDAMRRGFSGYGDWRFDTPSAPEESAIHEDFRPGRNDRILPMPRTRQATPPLQKNGVAGGRDVGPDDFIIPEDDVSDIGSSGREQEYEHHRRQASRLSDLLSMGLTGVSAEDMVGEAFVLPDGTVTEIDQGDLELLIGHGQSELMKSIFGRSSVGQRDRDMSPRRFQAGGAIAPPHDEGQRPVPSRARQPSRQQLPAMGAPLPNSGIRDKSLIQSAPRPDVKRLGSSAFQGQRGAAKKIGKMYGGRGGGTPFRAKGGIASMSKPPMGGGQNIRPQPRAMGGRPAGGGVGGQWMESFLNRRRFRGGGAVAPPGPAGATAGSSNVGAIYAQAIQRLKGQGVRGASRQSFNHGGSVGGSPNILPQTQQPQASDFSGLSARQQFNPYPQGNLGEGPLSGNAQGLAQLGRGGDSMLMHVNKNEVDQMATSVNPDTGLPEAFVFTTGAAIAGAVSLASGVIKSAMGAASKEEPVAQGPVLHPVEKKSDYVPPKDPRADSVVTPGGNGVPGRSNVPADADPPPGPVQPPPYYLSAQDGVLGGGDQKGPEGIPSFGNPPIFRRQPKVDPKKKRTYEFNEGGIVSLSGDTINTGGSGGFVPNFPTYPEQEEGPISNVSPYAGGMAQSAVGAGITGDIGDPSPVRSYQSPPRRYVPEDTRPWPLGPAEVSIGGSSATLPGMFPGMYRTPTEIPGHPEITGFGGQRGPGVGGLASLYNRQLGRGQRGRKLPKGWNYRISVPATTREPGGTLYDPSRGFSSYRDRFKTYKHAMRRARRARKVSNRDLISSAGKNRQSRRLAKQEARRINRTPLWEVT